MDDLDDRPQRASRALFGSGLADAAQSLSVDGNLAGGVEQVLFSTNADEGAADRRPSGIGSGSVGLTYGLSLSHVAVDAHAGSFARYVPRAFDGASVGHDASVSLSSAFALAPRVSASLEASLGYQPVSVLNLFPDMFQDRTGQNLLVDYQYDGPLEHYLSTAAGAAMGYRLSSRSELSLAYRYGESSGSALEGGQYYQSLSAGFSHALARGLALRLGYGRRIGRYGTETNDQAETVRNHDIDAGIDFNRSLSVSRRTTLAVSTGTTFVTDGVYRRYDVVGTASLGHQMGRDWSTSLSYNRNVEFVQVVTQPVFSDSVFASLDGLAGRRVTLHFGAGASLGSVGGGEDTDNRYRAYQAAASIQTAMSRFLGVSVGYVYYDYRFDSRAFLPTAVRERDRRHTAHVSVDVFLPLFQRGTRSSNASR